MMKAASYDKIEKLRPWRDWKTCQPGFARWKCTPSAYGTSPRESVSRNFQSPYGSLQISFACHPGGGGLLSAQPCANLSRSSYSNGKSSPFGGKVVPKVPKGVHFLAPKARLFGFPARRAVCLFSHGRSPVVCFLQTGGKAAHLNPHAHRACP